MVISDKGSGLCFVHGLGYGCSCPREVEAYASPEAENAATKPRVYDLDSWPHEDYAAHAEANVDTLDADADADADVYEAEADGDCAEL